jgi:hypothetical protein
MADIRLARLPQNFFSNKSVIPSALLSLSPFELTMKKFLVASLFAATAAMGLSSCMNGDYDANPTTNNGGNNPLNPGGGNGGGGSSFDWGGNAPMTVKLDGNGWGPGNVSYLPSIGGMPASVFAINNKEEIVVGFPESTPANTVVTFNNTNFASYTSDMNSSDLATKYTAAMGGGGAVQIIENDATHVKGKFYFNAKNTSGGSHDITEGYFDVTK